MALCPLCRSRKGKRPCPGIHGTICSVCCGEKRIVEVPCPADCAYLRSGTDNDLRREASDYLKHQSPEKGIRWLRTLETLGFLLDGIEGLIAALPSRTLDDSDLRSVLECARMTFDAEAKGIIYEDLPPSPSMQAVTRDLVSAIRAMTTSVLDELRRVRPDSAPATWGAAESAQCLQVIVDRCDFHLAKTGPRDSFFAHLRRIHPPAKGATGAAEGPRILLA